ncbi:MAG TPA: S24 family peptidase [Allosphingosinicella sp.]|nr:S24 family peptidase [Allosphingosinicella sp.]
MPIADQREALRRLIEERREDYAGLSRLIGRNAAYIQQFIKRGSPRRLAEEDARKLARYFGVAPAEFGLAGTDEEPEQDLVRVPLLNVGASAGPGALNEHEATSGYIAFTPKWLRRLGSSSNSNLKFIMVQGDSMTPTLSNGDDILVDEGDAADRLRDGIYVLRVDENLMVKRLAVSPANRTVTIKSDNPAYPDWVDCDPGSITIIGRVVWAGRKLT